MERHGFMTIDTEWWHFDDSNYYKYEIVDVKLECFIL
jgi:D-alanyl-D-alanine dipeptidase